MLLGLTTAVGVVIGLLHDCWLILVLGYPPARGRGRHTPRSPYLVPVWLAAVALAWAVLYLASWGTVRGFVMLGFGLGAALYYLILSRAVRLVMTWLRWSIGVIVRMALDALTWCVLLPWRMLCWIGLPIIALLTAVLAVPAKLVLGAAERLGDLVIAVSQRAWLAIRRLPPPSEPPDDRQPPVAD